MQAIDIFIQLLKNHQSKLLQLKSLDSWFLCTEETIETIFGKDSYEAKEFKEIFSLYYTSWHEERWEGTVTDQDYKIQVMMVYQSFDDLIEEIKSRHLGKREE
jgi:hypothetical protein